MMETVPIYSAKAKAGMSNYLRYLYVVIHVQLCCNSPLIVVVLRPDAEEEAKARLKPSSSAGQLG